MGKESRKRKRSRSPSRERRRGDSKTEEELQKMKAEIHNLTKLVTDFVSQRREEHRVEKTSTENTESANKENVHPQDENREELLDTSSRTEETPEKTDDEEKDSQKESCDVTIAEEILNLLGDDPNAVQGGATKLHPEIKNRWETWMKEGLAEDNKKTLTKKYSRKGDLYAEPPKVNLEISPAMTDIAKKRDDHFVQTQECVGTAIVSLRAAVSLLIDDSDNEVDQMKLIELLCDTGKLLTDVFHQQSVGRKSFITPMLKKSVKPVVESTHSDEWLYGQKLAEQIKEVKTIESACQNLKAPDKKFTHKTQNQGNGRGPSAQYRQAGAYQRKQFVRFKQRAPYRPTQSGRDRNRSTKEPSKK